MASLNKLTDKGIKSAWQGMAAGAAPVKMFDGGGMYLLLQAPKPQSREPGPAYWRLKYRIAGVEKSLSLGVYPETSLSKARDRRDAARTLLKEGGDPSQVRKSARVAQRTGLKETVKVVAEEWLGLHKTWAQSYRRTVVGRLELHVYPEIGRDPIAAIDEARLIELLRKIERLGISETAHRIRADLDRIFRYAKRTLRIATSPVPHPEVLAPREVASFASIKDPQVLGGLMRSIGTYHGYPTVRHALRLSPLVFLRPCELRDATWDEVDIKGKLWVVDASRMKNRLKHIVPLSQQAVAILKAQREVSGHLKHVFPSIRKPKQPMSNNTINAALRTMGFSGDMMTGHGFRHTASTLLHESNKFESLWIERQLSHVDANQIRGIYNAAEYLKQRRTMMQWWADYLDTLASGAKVVAIGSAKKRARARG